MKLLIRSLVIASAVVFGGPGPAHAHFKLDAPASWANQDSLGLPLKSAPCGQSDPGTPPVATNAVTGLMAGSTVTITVTETVFHPGHYRVALAADQNSLPADPTAHPDTNSPCGTADIMTTPVLPVLADNMLALGPNGEAQGKQEQAAASTSGPAGAAGSYTADEYKFETLTPDVVVMTHRGTTTTADGKKESHRSLHVFQRRGGAWQVVSSAQVPIPAKP